MYLNLVIDARIPKDADLAKIQREVTQALIRAAKTNTGTTSVNGFNGTVKF